MMERRKKLTTLDSQIKRHVDAGKHKAVENLEYEGNIEQMISTGSTLLDLAISGGRVKGGGIPGGILVEIFGPSSTGKTVLLCEIAGMVQRAGGQVMFKDPEARLNKQFAQLFGLDVDSVEYDNPDTVAKLFSSVRKWSPNPPEIIHGIFADSLAALTTDAELTDKDPYGMRRAKEFSEECRKTCRILNQTNMLMVCSNQVRVNMDAGPFGQKYKSPGGEAIGFYASLRLRCGKSVRIKEKRKIGGDKSVVRVIGITTEVEVHKSSIWKPYQIAPIDIIFDYGIDDIRANVKFVKLITNATVYNLGEYKLGKSLDDAIAEIEDGELEKKLQQEVIGLWEELEAKFEKNRKKKKRIDRNNNAQIKNAKN